MTEQDKALDLFERLVVALERSASALEASAKAFQQANMVQRTLARSTVAPFGRWTRILRSSDR